MLHKPSSPTDALHDLQVRLKPGVTEKTSSRPTAEETLQAIASDALLQKQLRKFVERRTRLHRGLILQTDDVIQEIHLMFAQHLRRRDDLGYSPEKGKLRKFLIAFAKNLCMQVIHNARHDVYPRRVPLRKLNLLDRSWQHERFVDELRELVRTIPNSTGATVRLFLDGNSIAEIANKRGLSERSIYRHLHQASNIFQSVYRGELKHSEKLACQKRRQNHE